ncbi:MAG: two-component system activity regulator YycH [Clostridia bacterium]|nr:two-component system activity regulator YycH [Clostridia bacterium]
MTNRTKENIKSVIIVVLFLTTILLLYLVFAKSADVNIKNLLPHQKQEEVLDAVLAKDVAVPKKAVYSNGSGAYISANEKDRLFEKALAFFASASNQGTMMVSEVSLAEYEEAVHHAESLSFNFDYSIPFSEFIKTYEIKRASGFANINSISAFVFSGSDANNIIAADYFTGKYFRIVYESERAWKDEILLGREPSGESSYRIDQVLGLGAGALVPVSTSRKTEEIVFITEDYSEESPILKSVASTVFGNNFSFVRRIHDNFGNLTFMYGYGGKTLSSNANGSLEYKQTDLQDGSSNGFYGDLQTAVNFIAACGGFNVNKDSTQFVLAGAEKDTSSDSYTFYFMQELDGEIVYTEKPFAVMVRVEKGQVSSYLRQAIYANRSYAQREEVLQAANAIIQSRFGFDLSVTAENLVSISTCYKEKDGNLVPSWMLRFADGSTEWIGLKRSQY